MGFLLFLFLCGSLPAWADFFPNRIIGEDNSIVVSADGSNLPVAMVSLVDAFGWSNFRCTMTHIGQGYVLTAGHCFEAKKELTRDIECQDALVKWGYRQGTEVYLESKCEKIVAMQNDARIDFALIKVFPIPHAYVSVDLNPISTNLKTTLFSHPRGLPLRWAQYCNIENAGLSSGPGTAIFHHQCDTEGGSSGAVLIDAATLKIVGIHNGRVLETNYGSFVHQDPLVEILKELGF